MSVATTYTSSDALLPLLRVALFGVPDQGIDVPVSDWADLYKCAERQACVGLVADAVSRLGLKPDAVVASQFSDFALQNIMSHGCIDRTLSQVVPWLREHGFDPLLLKGQGMSTLYPCPQARSVGDIDLYAGADDFDSCVAAIGDAISDGTLHAKPLPDQEMYKHFTFVIDGVNVELHRVAALPLRPWHKGRLDRWLASHAATDTSASYNTQGVDVRLPSATYDAFYIFYHIVYHLLAETGIGLRHLCDWAMVLHARKDSIDRTALEQILGQMSLMPMWQAIGYLLVRHLGLPEEEMPFYTDAAAAKADMIYRVILEGGNFGHHRTPDGGSNGNGGHYARRIRATRRRTAYVARIWRIAPTDVCVNYVSHLGASAMRSLQRIFSSKNHKS